MKRPITHALRPNLWCRVFSILALVGMLTMLLSPALRVSADDVSNNLDATVDSTFESMTLLVGGSNGTTQLRVITQNGDGKSGCNLTGSTTLVVNVLSSNPGVAMASPTSATFTSCSDTKLLTVAPVSAGSATISLAQVSNSTVGTFDLAPASFTVTVTSPNSAPAVSVTGVTNGASYTRGSVPAAGCDVVDSEDGKVAGNVDFAATLSAITGPYASDGIGSQGATCSYTDGSGLSASASASYAIIDPSAPVISYVLSPPSPDGNSGWYRSNVSLTWTVAESDSPSSLAKTGCVNQNITADQAATTYSCSASSAGGSAAQVDVIIKRDATAPTISSTRTFTGDSTAYTGGWTRFKVTVLFSCTDNGGSGGSDSSALESITPVQTDGQASNGTVASTQKCIDPAGNESAFGVSDIVQVDKVDPVVSPGNVTDTVWRNTSLAQDYTAFDADSGLADPADVAFTVTAAGESTLDGNGDPLPTTASHTVFDGAGNGTTRTVSALIDSTDPVITASATTADDNAYAGGWTNQTVTVHFTCSDALSGIPGACPEDVVIDSDTSLSGQFVSGFVSDHAGNSASSTPILVKVDKTGPTITASATTADTNVYGGGWTTQTVTVHFECSDGLSGVAGACPEDVVVSSDTPLAGQSVTGSITDNAGNSTGTTPIVVMVDKTAPSINLASIRNADNSTYFPGAGNWTNQNVTVTWTCADALSGPVSTTATDMLGEGAGQTAHGTCPDNAGNSASSSQGSINIDKTNPTNLALSFGPSFYFGSVPALPTTCTASDALSGLATCTVALKTGDDGQRVGPHTLVGTGIDNAGNAQTAEFGYAVLGWNTGGFYAPVSMLATKVNTIKGGQTVPLKFEVFAGPYGQNEQTSTAVISGFTVSQMTCDTADVIDPVDFVTTGGTSLRYDGTAGQFIQNWKTPTSLGCYRVTVTMIDGSKMSADFKVTK